VGEVYNCEVTNFTGVVIADTYNVNGGNSPGDGFGANAGVNYQFTNRLTGATASSLIGYRLGATGGPSPRQASDFSINGNRLTVASRNGNGRFEFTADGTSGFDFGSLLAGRTYELSVQMNIDVVGASYAQRLSLSVSDTSNASVDNLDMGMQIGTDGTGGLGVFKRIDAASSVGGSDVNTRIINGLPIGTPIDLKLRVTDFNADSTSYNSTFEIFVNGVNVNSGSFRFNASTATRYLIFDVAGHEGAVHYDNLQLTVTANGNGSTVCRRPILALSDWNLSSSQPGKVRLYWTAQPGLTVFPEWSGNLFGWQPITNAVGNPLSIATPHGSFQWLEVSVPPSNQSSFFRLRRQ